MLHERHPLMGHRISLAEGASLVIYDAEDSSRFNLRIAPENLGAASIAFGCELPATIGATASSGGRLALCLGPDEWQLYAPIAESTAIEAAFAALYPRCSHSLVDVGHREIGIAIEGQAAVLALRSACAFDFDTMPSGTGTRTLFDKAQIILIRHDENRFRIEVWRSFADHVWGLLQAASREIALGI
ncbi:MULTISPECIES: sarcosine oxidase subunit gamma family protein [unclassified Mesorhizobium]|uniref:sarcosine oxidase subunit gamma n=1 Tax=unclassified Mesorhizobium TaxID=325217 RepID=UPI000FDB724F|nr:MULTISPECIES: sarcosine oxidase subunit gamma family protein [unclassified Mesorhizobium]TGR17931.1 sarcosine oxidase [Mesorhizobium sp. M8A.F.Ca.ET.197.01.1.1]TGR36447.1 sarcosine oxidase [bacterium M00.F.Ca.ET.199.01.1.1]TGR40121.1 sarcosine oxidase [Mesorhizobium sp. M8A.F.Ca.ET.198.01.1.1]TGV80486.1 sarcosine oxidase [Mesorhizobium sp. M00.F.Ca.ET.149.01.1.1]